MRDSVLVLSHLFPDRVRPGNGPFVADEIALLRRHYALTVVSPMRWLPPAPSRAWRRERGVARHETMDGVHVWRPRVPAIPSGGLALESRLWTPLLWPLVKRLARGGVSLLHAHFALPDGFAGLALARRLRVPLVVTVYGNDLLAYPAAPRLRTLVRLVMREASHVIAVSPELRAAAIRLGANPRTVTMIPSSAPERVRPLPYSDARRSVQIGADTRCIIWIGNDKPKKRPLVALDAFARVARESSDLLLVMIGEGSMQPSVARRAAELGIGERVRRVGHVDRSRIAVWQSAADVILSSSSSEGTPNALVEAVVCGTPIAAFPVGGIPFLVEKTGAGTLADGDDATALAAALRRELELRRARAKVIRSAQPFTRRHTFQSLLDVYGRLIHA